MPYEERADINQDEIVTIVDTEKPERGRRPEEIQTLRLKERAKNDSRNNTAIVFIPENATESSNVKTRQELENSQSMEGEVAENESKEVEKAELEEEQAKKVKSMEKNALVSSSDSSSSDSSSEDSSSCSVEQNTQVIKSVKHRNLYPEHLSIGNESDERIMLDESEDSICEIPIPPKPKPPTIDLDYSESSTSSDSDTSTEIMTKEKSVESCRKTMSESKAKNQKAGEREKSVAKNKTVRSSGCNSSKSGSDEGMTESERQNWDVIPGNQMNKDKPTTSCFTDVRMSEFSDNLNTDGEPLLIDDAESNRSLLDVDESRATETLTRTSENRKRAATVSGQKSKHQNSPKKAKRSDEAVAAGSSSSKSPKENKENRDKQKKCTAEYFFKPMTNEMENYYNQSWGGETFNIDVIQRQMPRDPQHWAVLKEDLLVHQHRRSRYWIESKCTNCNHTGHRMAECPEMKKLPSCHMCGAPGHREPRCPHKMCLGCGKKQETYMQVCNGCRRAFCNGCQSYGHVENNCPDLWRRYHVTTSHRNMNTHLSMENVMKPQRFLSCCNCAKRGHDSTTCNSYRWSRHFPTPSYVTNYTTGPSYGEHRILEDIEFPSEASDQTETEKRQTDDSVAHTSSSSNEEMKEKSNADNVTREDSEMEMEEKSNDDNVTREDSEVEMEEKSNDDNVSKKDSEVGEVLQDIRMEIDENVEKAEEESEEQRKCSKKKTQKSDKQTYFRAMESREVLFTLESKLLDTDFKQSAYYREHIFPLRVTQYDLLVKSEFLHNITSQFPMKLEIKRLENEVIAMCVGSARDLQYPIFQTIMDWLQRPLNEQNRFSKLNLPTKKQDLVKLLTRKLDELKQNIGDPFKLFARIRSLKRRLAKLQHPSKAEQKTNTSSEEASVVEKLAEFQSKLNMVLFGQVKLNKSDKSFRFLKSALLDMKKAPMIEYICAATYLQVVHHYNIIFAAYTPDKLHDLLDRYFQKYSGQGPTRKEKVPSIYETDGAYFNFIEERYRANLKQNAYSSMLEKSNEVIVPNINVPHRPPRNRSQSTGAEHAHESTTCDNNHSSGNVSTPSFVTNCTTAPPDGEHHTLEDVEIPSKTSDQTETEKKQIDSSVAHTSLSSNKESKRKLNTDEVTKDDLKMDEFLESTSKEIDKNVEKAEEQSKKQKILNEEETEKSNKILSTNSSPVKKGKFPLTFRSKLLDTVSEQSASFGKHKVSLIPKNSNQQNQYNRLADSLSHEFFLNLTSRFPIELEIIQCQGWKVFIYISSTRDLHIPIQLTIMDWIKWQPNERDRFVNLNLPMMKDDLVKLLTEKLDELKQDLGDPVQLFAKIKRLNREMSNFNDRSQSKDGKKISTHSERTQILEELTKSQCKLNMILLGQVMGKKSETSLTVLRIALRDLQRATSPSHICPATYLKLVHHYNIIFAAYTPSITLGILQKYWQKYSGQGAGVKFKKSIPPIRECNTTYANFISKFSEVNQNRNTNSVMMDGLHQIIPQNVESMNWESVKSIPTIPVADYNNTIHNRQSNLPSDQNPVEHSWGRQENNYYNPRYNFGENSGSQWYRGTVQNDSQQDNHTALGSCGLENNHYAVGRNFSNIASRDYIINFGGRCTDENTLRYHQNETVKNGFGNSSWTNVESNSFLGRNISQEGYPPYNTASQDMFFYDTRTAPSQNFLRNNTLDVYSRTEIESRNRYDVNGPSTSGMHNQLRTHSDNNPGTSAEQRKIDSNKKKKKKKKAKGSNLPSYLKERVEKNIAKYVDISDRCISQAATALQRKLKNNDLTLRNIAKFEKLVKRKLKKTDHLL